MITSIETPSVLNPPLSLYTFITEMIFDIIDDKDGIIYFKLSTDFSNTFKCITHLIQAHITGNDPEKINQTAIDLLNEYSKPNFNSNIFYNRLEFLANSPFYFGLDRAHFQFFIDQVFSCSLTPQARVDALNTHIINDLKTGILPNSLESFSMALRQESEILWNKQIKLIGKTNPNLFAKHSIQEIHALLPYFNSPFSLLISNHPCFESLDDYLIILHYIEKNDPSLKDELLLSALNKAKTQMISDAKDPKQLGAALLNYVKYKKPYFALSKNLAELTSFLEEEKPRLITEIPREIQALFGGDCDGLLASPIHMTTIMTAAASIEFQYFSALVSYLRGNNFLNWEQRLILLTKSIQVNPEYSCYGEFLFSLASENFDQILDKLPLYIRRANQELSSQDDLEATLSRFLQKDEEVIEILNIEEIEEIKTEFLKIAEYQYPLSKISPAILLDTIRQARADNNKHLLLACIFEQCQRVIEYRPYVVQIINLLLLINKPRRIAQIKTGEGKSLIIAMMSAYLALMDHETVWNISTNQDLANRDYIEYRTFYDALDIRSNIVCNQYSNRSAFQAQILYGRISDFEFARLNEIVSIERFTHHTIADRSLEEDNFILDKHDESSRPVKKAKALEPEVNLAFDFAGEMEKTVMHKFTASASSTFSDVKITQTYSGRLPCIIVDEADSFCLDEIQNHARLVDPKAIKWLKPELYQLIQATYLKHQKEFNTDILKSAIEINFPDYNPAIKPETLHKWMLAVKIANEKLEKNRDYIIKDGQAIIVDWENTGTIRYGQRWNNGIHSFVEAKEGLRILVENFITASMSHLDFFSLSSRLYAVTGTVGNEMDKYLLKHLFQFDIYYSPRRLPSQKISFPDRIVEEGQHLDALAEQAMIYTLENRPVLILVDSIAESQILYERLGEYEGIKVQLYNGLQSNPLMILTLAGNPGMITVATNTAGRGADISPLKEVESYGGLALIIGNVPKNMRVAEQAEGRVARQGRKGSSQSIMHKQAIAKFCPEDASQMTEWRAHRDALNNQKQALQLLQLPKFEILYLALKLYKKLPTFVRKSTKEEWAQLYTRWHEQCYSVAIEQFKLGVINELGTFLFNASRYLFDFNLVISPYETVQEYMLKELQAGMYEKILPLLKQPLFLDVLLINKPKTQDTEHYLLSLQTSETTEETEQLLNNVAAVMVDFLDEEHAIDSLLACPDEMFEIPPYMPYEDKQMKHITYLSKEETDRNIAHLKRLRAIGQIQIDETITGNCVVAPILPDGNCFFSSIDTAFALQDFGRPKPAKFNRHEYLNLIETIVWGLQTKYIQDARMLALIQALEKEDRVNPLLDMQAWKKRFGERWGNEDDMRILSRYFNIHFDVYYPSLSEASDVYRPLPDGLGRIYEGINPEEAVIIHLASIATQPGILENHFDLILKNPSPEQIAAVEIATEGKKVYEPKFFAAICGEKKKTEVKLLDEASLKLKS